MADGNMSPRSMLDLATLASSLGKTKRAVEIRAKREGWAPTFYSEKLFL